jgi:hypothetical protein
MKRFSSWLEEKKKKREPTPTTPTSAPLRGANQDYSGVGVKRDVADYTISDEYLPEIIAGVGAVRTTPANMKSSGDAGSKNAPSSTHSMQHDADRRRMQLDKIAQQQKELQTKKREDEIKKRQANANNL